MRAYQSLIYALPFTFILQSTYGQSTSTNLVVNGGFETGNLQGWTLNGNNLIIGTWGVRTTLPGVYYPHTGTYEYGDYTSNPNPVTLSQFIPTRQGATYQLTYFLVYPGNFEGIPGYQVSLQTAIGGTVLSNLTNATSQTPGYPSTYEKLTFTFTGTGGPELLSFTGIDTQYFLTLDDISVNLLQPVFGNFYGNYLTPNEYAVANYIDTYDAASNVSPNFQKLVQALDGVSGTQNILAGSFDQLNTLKFQNYASSEAFNSTPMVIDQFDNYLESHRANGGFVASNGGLDVSGLAVADSSIDPALQSVHSRLAFLNPNANTSNSMDSKDMTKTMVPVADSNDWNVFAAGNVVLAQDFSDANTGLAHSDQTGENVQLGADYLLSKNWLVGATFGYGHSSADLDTLGSRASLDSYAPGLYGAYTDGNWYANGLFSYDFNEYNQHRNVQIGSFTGTATSRPSGSLVVVNGDGGYDFHSGSWTYGPTLGLNYNHLDVNGYSESGLAGANLSVNDDQADSLRTLLGCHVSDQFRLFGVNFQPTLRAGWQHEFLDQARGITSQFEDVGTGSFTVKTASPSRDSALADVGLNVQVDDSVSTFANYTVQAGQSNYFGQSVQAGVKIGF